MIVEYARRYTVLYYHTLYYTILWYTELYYTILFCNKLYCIIQYKTTLYRTAQRAHTPAQRPPGPTGAEGSKALQTPQRELQGAARPSRSRGHQ